MQIHSPSPLHPARKLDRLGDEIAELSAHLDAATARLLELIRAFDARGGWNTGFRSCAAWLSWRVGLDLGAARERVRVARALGTLPLLAQALARGELSYAKVRALTRVATPETEERLLGVGRAGTAAHVERIVRGWRPVDRQAEAREAARQHASRVVMRHDEDGRLLEVGARTRTIPPALRRALQYRDQGCRFPGCGLPLGEGHHVRHWAQGGPTTLSNLALLCHRHHRAVHEEGYQLERLADGELQFRHPNGWILPDAPPAPDVPDQPVELLHAERSGRARPGCAHRHTELARGTAGRRLRDRRLAPVGDSTVGAQLTFTRRRRDFVEFAGHIERFLPSIVAAAAILRRPVDKLAHGSELIPQFAEPRDHPRQGREKPLGRVADSLGIVQIHDRAWMGTFHDVLDLPRGRHGAQALTLDRPEHTPQAVTPERAVHRRIHHAPGRTEVADRTANCIGEKAMGTADLVLGAARAAEPETPARPAVATDLVTRRHDAAHRLGRPCRALADKKERSSDRLAVQESERPLGPGGVRAVVEGERDTPARRRAAPDAARGEQMSAPGVRGPARGRAERQPREDHRARTTRSRTAPTIRRVASGRRSRRIRARRRSSSSGSSNARSRSGVSSEWCRATSAIPARAANRSFRRSCPGSEP